MTGDAGDSRRTFYALWPHATAVRDLAALAARCAQPVHPADLHLTVVFVGAVSPMVAARLPALAAELGCPALDLEFDRIEYWPGSGAQVLLPRTVPAQLRVLHDELAGRLVAAGVLSAATGREFRPHVTLSRAGAAADYAGLVLPAVRWRADALCVAVSHPGRDGPHYRRVLTVPLG